LSASFLVAIGGVFGSLFRYFLGVILPSNAQGNLAANIIASAFAAHLLVLMERRGITQWRYILLPGFCGGLGTFSAVTYEAVVPHEGGFSYLILNIILSFTAVAIALPLSRKWVPEK
jgi:CrcB protein